VRLALPARAWLNTQGVSLLPPSMPAAAVEDLCVRMEAAEVELARLRQREAEARELLEVRRYGHSPAEWSVTAIGEWRARVDTWLGTTEPEEGEDG